MRDWGQRSLKINCGSEALLEPKAATYGSKTQHDDDEDDDDSDDVPVVVDYLFCYLSLPQSHLDVSYASCSRPPQLTAYLTYNKAVKKLYVM